MEKRKVRSFTDLQAWQEAHRLVIAIYKNTTNFPKEEVFGLTNQLRRAAVSISSNIAEGFSRKTKKAKIDFYHNSLGSLTEVQNQILIAKDIGYMSNDQFETLAKQTVIVSKLLNGIIKSASNK